MRRRFVRGAGPVLVVLVCALAVGVGTAQAGEADFTAQRAASPRPVVDGASSPRDFVAIGADQVTAVTGSSAGGDYPASNVLDGRAGVPWISSASDRNGASVTLRFTHVRWLDHVDVVVGHGRDNVSFHSFARPATVEIVFADGHSERYPMKDARKEQRITFVALVVTDSLTLVMRDVQGPPDAGVAISEITAYEPRDVYQVDPAFRTRITEIMALVFDDPARHDEGVALLDRFGRHATPFLLQRVMDTQGANRRLALSLVRRNDEPAARRAVAQLLTSASLDDVLLALEQLRDAPELEEPGTLVGLLRNDARLMVRRAAFFALTARPPATGWRELLEAAAADRAPTLRAEALRAIGHEGAPWAHASLMAHVRSGPIDDARIALDLLITSRAVDFAPIARLLRALPAERLAPLLSVLGVEVRPETTALLVDLLVSESSHTIYRSLLDALDAHGRDGLAALLARLEAGGEVPLSAADFLTARASAAADLAGSVLSRVVALPDRDDLVETLVEVVSRAGASGWRDSVVRVFTDDARSPRVRDAALACLGRLASTPYTESIVRGQVVAARTGFRASAYRAAIDMRLADVVPQVRARLAELPPRLWDPPAVEVVANLGGADDLAFLIDRYIDANRPSQVVILQGAYRSGTTPGVRLLIDAAAGPDRTLRRYAERHLAEAKP